jgi:hypothetical protein
MIENVVGFLKVHAVSEQSLVWPAIAAATVQVRVLSHHALWVYSSVRHFVVS